ncbi:MAG: hypothetical protein WDW38_008317 [Sanguina aurantia]
MNSPSQYGPLLTICAAASGGRAPLRTSATATAQEPVAFIENIQDKELHLEASDSYLSYAMSVIVGRALPDVRDGLKPVHRRILFAMHDLGLAHGKPFKKCARVVGEVLGKYHPHGDTAVYDAMVRLAQDFSMRDPLVRGIAAPAVPSGCGRTHLLRARQQRLDGPQCSQSDDPAAAPVDEPLVLPARIPHLLVNGASGIAVGIATRIPPHNMREVVAGLRALIHNPDISVGELMEHVPAPDFPTGGEVVLGPESLDMYATGRGSVLLRAKVTVEDDNLPPSAGTAAGRKKRAAAPVAAASRALEKVKLVITEVPYQTSKADLVLRIAELVEDKTIEGVSDVRDESDREGMRVVIEVKKGHPPESVLQQLFKHTRLQQRFHGNMVALVVALIRASADSASARAGLMAQHGLSEGQAEAVLGLTLRRLTGLEAGKLAAEATSLTALALDLRSLLADKPRVLQLVLSEAEAVAAKHGTPRRTRLFGSSSPAATAPPAAAAAAGGPGEGEGGSEHWSSGGAGQVEREVLLVYNQRGYVKRQDVADFSVVKRGKSSAKTKEPADLLQTVLKVTMAQPLVVLTSTGRGYNLQAQQIPEVPVNSAGTAVAQVLKSPTGISSLVAILPMQRGRPTSTHSGSSSSGSSSGSGSSSSEPSPSATPGSLLMVTSRAGIKRTETPSQFHRRAGAQMINLGPEDRLTWAGAASEDDVIVMASSHGRLSAFPVREVRKASLASTAVKGMTLSEAHTLVSICIIPPQLAATCSTTEPLASMEEQSTDEDVPSGSSSRPEADGSSDGSDGSSSGAQAPFVPCILMLTLHGYGKKVALSEISIGKRAQSGRLCFPLRSGDQDALAEEWQPKQQTPKVALLFLITTHVKHADTWGRWLQLAEGLQAPVGAPVPSHEVDLTARYGAEHPHQTVVEGEKTLLGVATRRTLSEAVSAAVSPTHARARNASRHRSSGTFFTSNRRLQEAQGSRGWMEVEARACLQGQLLPVEGEETTDVEKIYSAQSLFSIYLHSLPGNRQTRHTIFSSREVTGRVKTSYSDHSLIRAERALLVAALRDPLNVKFMVVAHDTIPLYPPYVIWAQLMSEGDLSSIAVNGFQSAGAEEWRSKAWDNGMETPHLKNAHFSKSSQWFVLTRPHAMLVVRDQHIDPIFADRCTAMKELCVSDELYVPTLLASYNAAHEMDGCGCKTHVKWPDYVVSSPTQYQPDEITAHFIEGLRSGDGGHCMWAPMVESAQRMFQDWSEFGRGNVTGGLERALSMSPGWSATVDDLAQFVKRSGFAQVSTRCAMMARKFPGNTKLAVAVSLLDCDGGGMSRRCRHPSK